MECIVCGKNEYNVDRSKFPDFLCSYKCYATYLKTTMLPNCKCEVCDKPMYVKPYNLKRVKHGITCSKNCFSIRQRTAMKGKNNHQYGLKGKLNSSWKGGKRISTYGYILVSDPTHIRVSNTSNPYVFEHVIIVEQNYTQFDPSYFIEYKGRIFLSKDYIVHHKDGNRQNNSLDNLLILTKPQHTLLHNKMRHVVLKPDEFKETP